MSIDPFQGRGWELRGFKAQCLFWEVVGPRFFSGVLGSGYSVLSVLHSSKIEAPSN